MNVPWQMLALASLALLTGPILGLMARTKTHWSAALDGLSLALIAGFCGISLIPHVVEQLGALAWLLLAVGAAIPILLHRLQSDRRWSAGVAMLLLSVHTLIDGTVLGLGETHAGPSLQIVVIAHRLPVGLALYTGALRHAQQDKAKGFRLSLGAIGILIIMTWIGALGGETVANSFTPQTLAAFEALVVGTLLHVVIADHTHSQGHPHHAHHYELAHAHDHDHGHHHGDALDHDHGHHHGDALDHDHGPHHGDAHDHDHDHDHGHHHGDALDHDHDHDHGHHHHGPHDPHELRWAAVGCLVGAALLVLIGPEMAHNHGSSQAQEQSMSHTFGLLLMQSAPALVIGYALAGMIPHLLTPARARSLGRGGRFIQAVRGVVFGLPLPVCSCGVLPLYESLIRRGAPIAAALAFFVATPEIGIDAILLSMPLLGGSLTLARVAAAIVVAIMVGLLVGRGIARRGIPASIAPQHAPGPWKQRIKEGLRFGFVDVFDHTMPWIAFGLLIAALVEPLLSQNSLAQVPSVLQVPLAAIIGIPIYVCASGATPVAAVAIHKGLSSGAALAFLIAGPATNVTTFGVLARLHSKALALKFGLVVTVLAVACGWAVDAFHITAPDVLAHGNDAHSHIEWYQVLSTALLGLLALSSLFRQGPRGVLGQLLEPIHSH